MEQTAKEIPDCRAGGYSADNLAEVKDNFNVSLWDFNFNVSLWDLVDLLDNFYLT